MATETVCEPTTFMALGPVVRAASRKLASVRRVAEVRPTPLADRLECALVGGWTVVVPKGEHKKNDLAVYLEIDSFVPNAVAPDLTRPGSEPKKYEGLVGQRLKTAKLRGQLSQGLLLTFHELSGRGFALGEAVEGQDVTDFLGVVKMRQRLNPPHSYARPKPSLAVGLSLGLKETSQRSFQRLMRSAFKTSSQTSLSVTRR